LTVKLLRGNFNENEIKFVNLNNFILSTEGELPVFNSVALRQLRFDSIIDSSDEIGLLKKTMFYENDWLFLLG
jgi:hypothetical protein